MNGANQIQTTQTLTEVQRSNVRGVRGLDSQLFNGLFWLFAVGLIGITLYLRKNSED